jgi:NADPH:quinone reductase-like Zn-dependent oxidoreductase
MKNECVLLTIHLIHLLQVGDRVVALPEYRAWAELCAVPTKYVYKLSDDVSFQDAAAITMNYLVAYIIVNELLSLRPGKSLMLHSAGGGVVSITKSSCCFYVFHHFSPSSKQHHL